MAGSQTQCSRSGVFAAALVIGFLLTQGRAMAQVETTPIPPSEVFAEGGGTKSTSESLPMTSPQPTYFPNAPMAQPDSWGESGQFDTMVESIFGQPDPNCWRPLPLSTLFSEGWHQAWVPSPSGSGGAPRQGWINAVDGNLYRLSFVTFAQGFNNAPTSNAYLGAYTVLLPLNRRLEVIINTPFVLRNSAASGQPIISPSQPESTTKSYTTFGDVSITPRVLLHETKDFSLTAELAVQTPTGEQPLAGKTSLTPAVGFWNNFSGGWVIRGGLGVNIPTEGSGNDTLISQLAIGQTVTPHDVPLFGDFTYYVSAVAGTPLSNGGETTVALTPGMRTHLGNDWYLLAGLPTPMTKQRVADLGMIFWFMKAW